ncbi:alpha-1,3-mannosyl-glycoprotein 2-beta-N-acetylglucosaminyltransferase a [Xiphophorus hellerii]|uniref:alpha-1,3-mannosyl-glycoprotein 2-beta-N-acetylglucosaminyltransferase a n=1 Tax=Xiphophorus hellerii TaxID=8084 RepID=UPI0013B44F8A|nr:alpha-1,3-mannosyl-glycoprotein 2-beta-N-acetylglucosaminyltransferase [Xiphophorus hellerii]XP_032413932.1 alpha-1,3-mannosyl-glycoprotein 2-beta-N-acetylglucosaminyltransferase [Xiphophorus hellerii]XP_032413933.1 alpha-1,3-mannosyl-glycoprotein 2-beta-N-acetylglucosaminyltransferase [Xiphophorus hellerii]XP_032413934.1 alpha-1,3-mannosyl-glycoprotein 2-beta-N-acetylglucosaminyltransferase [Xiphophorus hellerii]
MFRKRSSFILCGTFLFVTWNAVLVLLLWGRAPPGQPGAGQLDPASMPTDDVVGDVIRVADSFELELAKQKEILSQILSHRSLWKPANRKRAKVDVPSPPVIPILVIACNRVTVRRCLDKLLELRPSAELHPIIVSQDCGHSATADVIASYGDKVTHLKQPDLSDIPVRPEHKKFQGYYKISRHYRWALNQVFRTLSHSSVVIVEDDLEVAPDFFEYFRALHPVLRSDPTLWCASAWNDNGRDGMVDPGQPALLYRTDFFPGLGWMLLREAWEELEPKWPSSFWDDWMRQPEQRRGRACVRPEISRTLTFGRQGVSLGQFYDKYLKFIKLNSEFVPFTKLDLAYLQEDAYRTSFTKQVYSAAVVTYEDVKQGRLSGTGPFRLQYSSKDSFKVMAKNLGIMDDLKSGVPRTGYRGVVSFFYRGRRIYLAPPPGWSRYDPTWS